MTERLDLPRRYREQIEALLREHVPGVEVWAYGSRVNGRSHEGSDLDLVLRGPDLQQIDSGMFLDLVEALEESNVPIIVQAHDWARLPERFHREIERKYVVLVGKEGWKIVTLGDYIVANDAAYSSKETWRQINYLDTGNITENRISEIQNLTVGKDKIPSRARRKVQPGDMVYSTVRPNQRHYGLLKELPENLLVSTGFAVIRGKKGLACTDFIYWYLAQDHIVDQLHTIAEHSTSAYPSIRPSDIEELELYLPPLSEQRAIAHILGTLDDKIELNRRMNETLEEMARALFKSWFVDFDPVRAKMEGRDTGLPPDVAALFPDRLEDSELGAIPEGWEVVPLPEMIEVNPPRSLRKGEVAPYLDMANMPTRGHVPDTVIDRPFGSGMRFTNGDTLVARITPCLENGKTAYVDFLHHDTIGWGSTEYIVLRPKPPLPNEFAYCLARSAGFREFAIQNMTGTSGRQRVPAKALSQFLLPLPPEPIAARFGKVVQPLFTRASEAVRESRTLAALRDVLLPKLVSGKLRVAHKFHDPCI